MRAGLGGLPLPLIWLGQMNWRRFGDPLHRRNESITLPGNGLHKARLLGVVVEDLADFPDGPVDTVVGIEKNVLAPHPFGDLIAADNLTSLLNEEEQNFQGDA